MGKFKAYIIAGLVILFFGMGVTIKVLLKNNNFLRSDNGRLKNNNFQLMSENRQNVNLNLSLEEFKKSMTHKVDSILKVAEIASKQVKTVTITNNYYIDSTKTVIKPDLVVSKSDTTYPFIDKKDCFLIEGFMKVVNDRPELAITKREFKNEVTIIGYEKRPHHFWFIRWGKKETFIESSSDCGKTDIRQINIIKK